MMLLPGIMGTELVHPDDGPIWGLRPKLLSAWLGTGEIFERLRDTRLEPRDLLRLPSWLPGMDRFEPYTELEDHIRDGARHPDAYCAYPYDWRRPVADVAQEFAAAAAQHLSNWRRSPHGSEDAQLTLVAHSMGGLVALRATAMHSEDLPPKDVRQIVTLGTPFSGSVKAVRGLAAGEVLPASWAMRPKNKKRLRELLTNLPGIHDLLPSHPCVGSRSPARASAEDFIAVGAHPDHTRRALADRAALQDRLDSDEFEACELRALIGTSQPTLQSFTTTAGETTFRATLDGDDHSGDGTVYYHAAYPRDGRPTSALPQSHGALARTEEAWQFVQSQLLGGKFGDLQGDGLGLKVTDTVAQGQPVTIQALLPRGAIASLSWSEVGTGAKGTIDLGPPTPHRTAAEGGDIARQERSGRMIWNSPGLYSVTLDGGGSTGITTNVLVEHED